MRIRLSLTVIAATLASASAYAGTATFSDTDYFANAGSLATVTPGIVDGTPVLAIPFTDGQSILVSQPVIKDNTADHPFQDPFVGLPGDPGDVFRGVGPLTFTIPSNAFGFYIAPNLVAGNPQGITSVVFQLVSLDSPDYSINEVVLPYNASNSFGRNGFFGFYGGGAHVFQLTEIDKRRTTNLGPDPYGFTIGDLTSGIPNVIITSVPEPATLALLGAGLIGLGMTRFRRRI